MAGTTPLKLRAHDAEDLRALAVCLQDALVPVSDMTYLKPDRRFVMVANRFKWEGSAQSALEPAATPEPVPADQARDAKFEEADAGPVYQRVNCALTFDWVRHVRFRGLDPGQTDQILNLLTIEAEPGRITLVFSDGATIRLEVSDIRCHLEDLGEPWPTRWRPSHAEAETAPPESD
jgi:hypothetical protein